MGTGAGSKHLLEVIINIFFDIFPSPPFVYV